MKTEGTSPPKRGICCCLFEFLLLLVVLAGVFLGLTYHLGGDELHQDVPHILDAVFEAQSQKDFIKQLGKKSHQWTIIKGNQTNGLFDFL